MRFHWFGAKKNLNKNYSFMFYPISAAYIYTYTTIIKRLRHILSEYLLLLFVVCAFYFWCFYLRFAAPPTKSIQTNSWITLSWMYFLMMVFICNGLLLCFLSSSFQSFRFFDCCYIFIWVWGLRLNYVKFFFIVKIEELKKAEQTRRSVWRFFFQFIIIFV